MEASDRQREVSDRDQWARFRFSVIGPLLAAAPAGGELQQALQELAAREYQHPLSKRPITLGVSTIERWYYRARLERDPVAALRNQVRSDAGGHPSVSAAQRVVLRQQHRDHPGWSYQLHHDNLKVLAQQQPELGRVASYAVVRRWMKTQGLYRRKRVRVRHTAGARRAAWRLEQREVRSYEAEYVGGLFHADFHHASREVLTRQGQWVRPQLLAILDDKSRLCCHAQWYLQEDAENFAHGLQQAFLKRGLSRALMTDNGGAETAAEIAEGLAELGVLQELTLPYSPYQNAKQEVFWVPIETRLLAMLEGVPDLTLEQLNQATQAWIELEYHRRVHSETGQTPLASFLESNNVLRDCPAAQELRRAFRVKVRRTQRRSDGTLVLDGVRFELPGRLHHLTRVAVRYARWDLSQAAVVDERTGAEVATIYPVNKVNNASGQRRRRETAAAAAPAGPSGVAPLLQKLLADYAATGLPPAYLPKPENPKEELR